MLWSNRCKKQSLPYCQASNEREDLTDSDERQDPVTSAPLWIGRDMPNHILA